MPEISASKYMVRAGWDDVPHLDAQTKKELHDSTPPYLRDARSKGIPSVGAGAIYPMEMSEIFVRPIEIPAFWRRCFGLDVGWNRTAALWGATDPATQTTYLYSEYYVGQKSVTEHAAAIKARGAWIPGVIDPAARGRDQRSGEQLIFDYRENGLRLQPADNSVESGLYTVWDLFQTGRLKVFRTLTNFYEEIVLYRRDEKGHVVKEKDHLMDAMRYLVVSGLKIAIPAPAPSRGDRMIGSAGTGDTKAGY